MTGSRRLTAVIEREGDGYVSFCPELDVASQGDTIEEARANLVEALTLFLRRPHRQRYRGGCMAKCSSLKSRYRLGKLRVLSGAEVCRIIE